MLYKKKKTFEVVLLFNATVLVVVDDDIDDDGDVNEDDSDYDGFFWASEEIHQNDKSRPRYTKCERKTVSDFY